MLRARDVGAEGCNSSEKDHVQLEYSAVLLKLRALKLLCNVVFPEGSFLGACTQNLTCPLCWMLHFVSVELFQTKSHMYQLVILNNLCWKIVVSPNSSPLKNYLSIICPGYLEVQHLLPCGVATPNLSELASHSSWLPSTNVDCPGALEKSHQQKQVTTMGTHGFLHF